MDFSETLTELNIRIGDSENVTFTVEEKTSALQMAWNDNNVVNTVWDSITFSAGTFQYAVPSTMDTVKDIYVRPGNSASAPPQKIDTTLYEVIDGNIQFRNNAARYLVDGYTYYVKGNHKIDYATDSLASTNLQEYVLALGGYNTLTLLGYKKANLFLKNDLTVPELIALKNNFAADVRRLRGKLLREWETA